MSEIKDLLNKLEESSNIDNNIEDTPKPEEFDIDIPENKPKSKEDIPKNLPLPDVGDLSIPEKRDLPTFSSEFETESNSLPMFETSYSMPKGIVSNTFDIPSFDDTLPEIENTQNEEIEVPIPPPELREKAPHIRLQDIEDDYLETESSENEFEEAREKLEEEHKKPIYINVDDYGNVIETIKSTKGNIKTFIETYTRLENLNNSLDSELTKINKAFEYLQRRFIAMDNRLFENN